MRCFRVILLLLLLAPAANLRGQGTDYWVSLAAKDTATMPLPEACLARRARVGAAMQDWYDRPLDARLRARLASLAVDVWAESRWLNGLGVRASRRQIRRIRALPGVRDVRQLKNATRHRQASGLCSEGIQRAAGLGAEDSTLLANQTAVLGRAALQAAGLDGSGVRIAVLDAGFSKADKVPELAHLFRKKQVLAAQDFIGQDTNVYHGSEHGTMVLSCIAGRVGSQPMGLAPAAEFLLARTEHVFFESAREEYRWIAALEWAERHGADIVSSSLGYTAANHFRTETDGHSLISRAAAVAARKGMLVVNAAGNEAGSRWDIVALPGDADSILTVGGVRPESHTHISFSSVGPTADGRMKPELAAFGKAVVRGKKRLGVAGGTSFSAPLIAGLAACARQAFPALPPAQLRQRLLRSGRLYPYFDYAHGHGLPTAERLLADRLPAPRRDAISWDFHHDSNHLILQVDRVDTTAPFFFHLAGPDGRLLYYAAWEFSPGASTLDLYLDDLLPNRSWPDTLTLRARFRRHYLVASLDVHP